MGGGDFGSSGGMSSSQWTQSVSWNDTRRGSAVGGSAPRREADAPDIDDESSAKKAKGTPLFPVGQYVAARWPVTISSYPAKGERDCWQDIVHMAARLGC